MNSSSYVDRDQLGRTIRSAQLLGVAYPGGPIVDGVATSYEYGPFSLLQRSLDPQGNVTSYGYDGLGRIVRHSDYDSGTTLFVNDAFGEVLSMRDAEGRETLYGYDPAGRQVASKAPDGLSCFEYDAGAHAIGRRTRARRVDTDGATSDTVETWTDFDPLGRPSVRHQKVNGGPDLSLTLAYDTLGRTATLTYPEVGGQALRVANAYTTAAGYLQSVTAQSITADSGAGSPAKPVWEETSENRAGELTGESFGGGVIKVTHTRATDTGWVTSSVAKAGAKVVQSLAYDYYKDGNIKRRDDASERSATGDPVLRTDRYSYDAMKRLASWSGTWGRVDYDYDESDNLLHRTISGPAARTETFTPGLQGPRADGAPPSPPSPPHGVMAFDSHPYSYNRAGDQTSAPGRTVEWTTFHLPRRITQSDGSETRFVYGPDHERVQKIDARGTTTYVGDGLYERREHADGASSEHVMSIEAGGRPVAQTIWRVASGAVVGRQTTFLLQDHLGSPHVITDEAGTPVDHIVHEPFGRRVNPADPTTVFAGAGFDDVHAGFTGHEEDRELGLVNMRGRIYDPTSARFTSADPVVGAGMHNRYAYVRNNPINAADPSGFCDYLLLWCGGGGSSWFPTFGGYERGGAPWETPPTPPPTEGGPSYQSPPPPAAKPVQAPAPPRPFTSASGGAAVIRPFASSMFTLQTADGYCIVGSCGQRLVSSASARPEMQGVGASAGWSPPGETYVLKYGERTAYWVGVGSVAVGTAGMGVYVVGAAGAGAAWSAAAGVDYVATAGAGAAASGAAAGGAGAPVAPLAAAAAPGAAKVAEKVAEGGAAVTPRITSGSQVTEGVIRVAMEGAPLQSQQPGGVSLPRVQGYVDLLLARELPPPIKVDGQMIVDGNHRYIAGRLLGIVPPIQPWLGGRPERAIPWSIIPISPEAW